MVVCSSSLEHFKDDIKALKEMHRILKPDGSVVLTTDSFTYPISDELKDTLKERFEMRRSEYLRNSRITSFFFKIGIKMWSGKLWMVVSFIAYPLCLMSDRLFGVEEGGYRLIAERRKLEVENMTNILIVNFTSRLNKGSAALLNCKIKLLNNFFPDAKFVVSTYHPEIDYTQYDVKIVKVAGKIYPLKIMVGKLGLSVLGGLYSVLDKYLGVKVNIPIGGKKLQEYVSQSTAKARAKDLLGAFSTLFLIFRCTLWTMLHKFGLNVNRSFCGKSLQEYYAADIILNTGGDVLVEDYEFPFSHFVNLLFAILLDKPVIICAESLGPYKERWSKFITKFVFNRTKLITLREERSLKHLQEIGVNKPQIYVTVDVAFMLEPASDERIKEILTKEGLDESMMPRIGISVSKIISNYGFPALKNRQDKYNEYVKLMSKSIDYLINTLNATIVFVPHVIGPGEGNDDRTVADDICKLIKNRDKVVSIKEEYTPEELKGIIGQCDLFIGARMHTTIASTSMLVPTVGIAYSHKMHGIIGEMLGQEKYVIDIKELSYESLISKINDAWENRDSIKKDLEMKIPEIKEKAMLNGKLIKNVLNDIKVVN